MYKTKPEAMNHLAQLLRERAAKYQAEISEEIEEDGFITKHPKIAAQNGETKCLI